MRPDPSVIPPSVGIQTALTKMHIDEWLRNDLFRPRWWILLALQVLAVLAWALLVSRAKAPSVCLFAALCAIASMGVNEYGEELVLWDYPVDILPVFPPLTSLNLTLLPLVFSLIHQYQQTWKGYLLWSLAASAIICFAVEPLMALGGFFELVRWNYAWNLPVFVAIALAARLITRWIERAVRRSRCPAGTA